MKEIKIVYFRESFVQSFFADVTTFGFLCVTVWFNQNYCGGSYFLNAIILVMFIIFLNRKIKNSEFTSFDEAIKKLQKDRDATK